MRTKIVVAEPSEAWFVRMQGALQPWITQGRVVLEQKKSGDVWVRSVEGVDLDAVWDAIRGCRHE